MFTLQKSKVGRASADYSLLSLTLGGVIVRDMDEGGKLPAEFDNYQIVQPGDLVFCLFDIDETPRTIGIAYDHGMITGAYSVYRALPSCVPEYASYYFLHLDSFKGLRPFYTGLRKVVRADTFSKVTMPAPPLEEQKQIAAFLDYETAKIDALIEKQQQLIALLGEKRQAVISHAVTKGLNPDAPLRDSGVEWVGDIPEHWRTPPVYARYDAVLGKMYDENKLTGLHPTVYLRNADVNWDSINVESLPTMDITPHEFERFSVKKGDLLICEGGAGIGQTAIWQDELERCGFQKALHRLRPLDPDVENPRFFYYCMRFVIETDWVLAGGTATIPHLTGEQLRKYRFPCPPKYEQDEIVSHLDTISEKFDRIESHASEAVELLQERRTALISAAVTGKIDVRGWKRPSSDARLETEMEVA
ncbi:restriction endonuclease subunit S [Stieleria sp. TO1_6]|uniref:restriction endonuclease subunit S n=1 Tax=Stieleria tagensis TaxID=2956795 RepID=UPI00209ADDDF|nr:restriction endonuclease subunit S [Stieleria tagensis]MCO8122871.1 restriction endonuclease subunit S [Stieleria tagensis]